MKNLKQQKNDIIFRTIEYDMFVAHKENRIQFDEEPTNKEYQNLKKSIKEEGENRNAIIVNELPNGKFLVISGHHRVWACKTTNSELRYVIDNEYTLDKAIKFEMTTSKDWDRIELVERGIKNEVPLCLFANEMLEKYRDKISMAYILKLTLRYLGRTENFGRKYISEDNFYNKLNMSEYIELKKIKIDDNDKKMTEEMIRGFIEFYGENSNVSRTIAQNFAVCWNSVTKDNYEVILRNWKRIKDKMLKGEANPNLIIYYNELYRQIGKEKYEDTLKELTRLRVRQ